MKIKINDFKWDFYALFELSLYSSFTLRDEEVFDCLLRFYEKHKYLTNRQLFSLFSVAKITLTFFKEKYDHDLQRRNEFITRLANKYAHYPNKDQRIQKRLCRFVPANKNLQIFIWMIWGWSYFIHSTPPFLHNRYTTG